MSYILDALRRAEAERQRGQVPGLGAQPAAAAVDSDAPRRLPAAAWAAAGLLAAAALVLLAWWLWPAPAAPAAVVPASARPASSAAPAPPPASAAAVLPLVVSAPAPAPAAQPAPPAAPQPAALPAAAPASAPLALAALSPELRRQLPPLVLGGSIWSESATQRFIIVNGQVVHEGEAAAPGVLLERITPRTAVLRWRELRIEWPL